MTNPILDEIRATREALLAQAGGSLADLVARLQDDEKKSDRAFVAASPKPATNAPIGMPIIETKSAGDSCPSAP